jgi:hypothetical protein
MLYTIIFVFRRRGFAYQVKGGSVMEALRNWIVGLETGAIPNFGDLSRGRLTDALQRTGPGAVSGTAGLYSWCGPISGFDTTVWIVETSPITTSD